MKNFIVYDFETSGRSVRFDQVLQAGIIIFNENFQELEKMNLKCRINSDVVPSINALRVNKLTVPEILSEKESYYQMALKIYKSLKDYKDSYFVGFNSINFDEEFFRQILWEHFIFPYLTNTQGNSRLDVMNFATLIHAFRSNSINVGKNDSGKINFKLESLAKANSFESLNAHDAIADVETTMKLLEKLLKKNTDLFCTFQENSIPQILEKRITDQKVFTLHNYMFNNHRIYMVKNLLKHPVYKNQLIGFDLKYETSDIANLEINALREVFKSKSFFRKIKLNKQPSVLDVSFSRKKHPYSELSDSEINSKCNDLEKPEFLDNLGKILEQESIEYIENQSQEDKLEEETIYSENINFKDSQIMNRFHDEAWENKWSFAEKFKDQRLRYFAAKHIYRNFPEALPRKIFIFLHQKISMRLNSLKKEVYVTLPSAMEEADTLALELEENDLGNDLKYQIDQYNEYINFLNDYYSNSKPEPIKFDVSLSNKLFGS